MTQYNQFNQLVGDALPDWQPRPWPQRQTLQTVMPPEPLDVKHAQALFNAYRQAPDTRAWTALREPENSVTEFSAWIASISELNDPLHFAVIDERSGQPVGSLALMRIDSKTASLKSAMFTFRRC